MDKLKQLQDGTITKLTQIPSDEPRFIIDSDSRKITIPDDGLPAQLVLPEFIEFVTGQIYEVKWDDKTYSCVAFDLEGISAIGNQVVLGGTNTGEPFIMAISKADKIGIVRLLTPEAIGIHTVEVSYAKIVKLDKKYLPDLTLPKASTSVLGGVKVGTGLTIDKNGVLSLNVSNASGVRF